MAHRDNERRTERKDDLKYGQNLIKQLGYKKPHDKKPGNEPGGTLYDAIFATKVHQSKALSKKIEGTRLHAITTKMQNVQKQNLAKFDESHTFGGTLLENKTRRREDIQVMNKLNLQAATAQDLQR